MDHFYVYKNNVEDHYGQVGDDYFFESSFQEAYLERLVDSNIIILNITWHMSEGLGSRILMENRDKEDGIYS
jgi:hypothetical protein